MIEINNVTKSYHKAKTAVDGLTLRIPAGKIVGFLGPNGAGKTTTIKMITGVMEPDAGEIKICGKDIVRNALAAKREFGYVPDNPDVFLRLTGLEYLNFVASVHRVPEDVKRARIVELADCFEIADALKTRMISYSHGMRQKLVLTASLLHRPPVWILDEPLTGLDPKSSFLLKEMMRAHAGAGGTMFFSTHVLDVAEKICDVVAVIHRGRLLFYGELDELRARGGGSGDSLEHIFLEMTGGGNGVETGSNGSNENGANTGSNENGANTGSNENGENTGGNGGGGDGNAGSGGGDGEAS